MYGFRLTKWDDYFWVDFVHFWIEHRFFNLAKVVMKIVSSLKLNQLKQCQCINRQPKFMIENLWCHGIDTFAKLKVPKEVNSKSSIPTMCQFHQRFKRAFFVWKCFFCQNVTRKTCRKDFCTKNASINCWWNWCIACPRHFIQVIISRSQQSYNNEDICQVLI